MSKEEYPKLVPTSNGKLIIQVGAADALGTVAASPSVEILALIPDATGTLHWVLLDTKRSPSARRSMLLVAMGLGWNDWDEEGMGSGERAADDDYEDDYDI